MTVYDPLIPAANDLISDSQGDIQNNFSELNTLYDRDHQKWNANTSAFRGKHRKMTFPEAYTTGTIPGLGSDLGILFPMVDPVDTSARPQMYFKNATETVQVTNRFHDIIANDGYVILPGGIIYMWGVELTATSGAVLVTLPPISSYVYPAPPNNGFPTAIFNVQLTNFTASAANQPNIAVDVATFNRNSFTINVNQSHAGNQTFWFAIGN